MSEIMSQITSEAILNCEHISKKFSLTPALKDISLKIEPGHIIGLLGPNGSGKTTLMKCIAGLIQPDSGTLLVSGHPVGAQSKSLVSFLPDCSYLHSWMKVKQIIRLFQDFFPDFDEKKAYAMMQALELDPEQRLKSMSKGTLEKVQLTIAMSRRAKLYLLDEPIGGVDPAARDFILKTILDNFDEDGSILISTHIISDVEQILDTVIFMKHGEIVLESSVDEIRSQYKKSVDDVFREVFSC